MRKVKSSRNARLFLYGELLGAYQKRPQFSLRPFERADRENQSCVLGIIGGARHYS